VLYFVISLVSTVQFLQTVFINPRVGRGSEKEERKNATMDNQFYIKWL